MPERSLDPELRIDPLTGLKVVFAPQRADRPLSFEASRTHGEAKADCPFDEQREDQTPPETWALRPGGGASDSPGWLVRSVPNKYPVLSEAVDSNTSAPADPLASGRGDPDLFPAAAATGAHEVIIHSPRHLVALADLGPEQLRHVLEAWSARLEAHARARYVHVMVNEGSAAGASLEHSHTQVYALGLVPAAVARERERFTAHNTRTMGGCLLCDLLQAEVRERERVIEVDDDAVLLAPFASRGPYELRIVPRKHTKSFSDGGPAAAAGLLDQAVQRLRRRLGEGLPLNLWLRTAPLDAEHFHWHIDILPRLTVPAGFELGTGMNINIYPPERAAEDLREV